MPIRAIELFASIGDDVESDLPAVLLDGLDADVLGVGPRVEGQIREGLAEWIITTDLEDSADEHCFVADVSFEGHEEVAVLAGTCVSGDANTMHTELPS